MVDIFPFLSLCFLTVCENGRHLIAQCTGTGIWARGVKFNMDVGIWRQQTMINLRFNE